MATHNSKSDLALIIFHHRQSRQSHQSHQSHQCRQSRKSLQSRQSRHGCFITAEQMIQADSKFSHSVQLLVYSRNFV